MGAVPILYGFGPCSYDLQNRQYQALRTNKNGFLDHLFIDV